MERISVPDRRGARDGWPGLVSRWRRLRARAQADHRQESPTLPDLPSQAALQSLTVITGKPGISRQTRKPGSSSPFQRDRVLAQNGRLRAVARPGSRLTLVVAEHGALLPEERAALSRYRLEQYVLANLFSADLVERWGVTEDPGMGLLNAADTHVFAATPEGVIASYLSLQTASGALANLARVANATTRAGDGANAGALASQWMFPEAPTLAEMERPIFPVETEHDDLYMRHPGLRVIPVESVREISRLVRNQRADLRPLLRDVTDIAVAETIVAAAAFVIEPANRVEAIIGCMAAEARRMLFNYRIPVAYAKDAPIYGDNLGGAISGQLIWTSETRAEGAFWPFAISVLDVRRDASYYAELQEALGRSSTQEIREGLNRLRKRMPLRPPRFAATFAYPGYREDSGPDGFKQVALPIAWAGL